MAPNSSGAAGMMQYVQWIEPDIAVFDKATGDIAPGFPKPGNAIWFGFGGPCETQNIGSPNLKHDQLAKLMMIQLPVLSFNVWQFQPRKMRQDRIIAMHFKWIL